METIFQINPLLPTIVALLLAAIATSRRFSLNAANILLFLAWAAGVFAVVQLRLQNRSVKIGAECAVGVLALLISYWLTRRQRKSSRFDKQ